MAKAVTVPDQDRSSAQQGVSKVSGFFNQTKSFLSDVRGEMRKVVTPTREEVRSTTTVVIVAVFVFAAFFYVVDSVLDQILRVLLHSLGAAQ
ncbi:preprotein translocase subunit SecE [Silvibacterium acidisoli]|uniref:preprotein translocase subunit SecE n=1 Tax=Acidobacteriaceae bacterium ZG23-2 TaxID=2883246 RepID=UPI00406C0972